jgi:hypothetical protein
MCYRWSVCEVKDLDSGAHIRTAPLPWRKNFVWCHLIFSEQLRQFIFPYKMRVDRASSVGIATRYGLGGPGIEFLWGRVILHLSTQALEPTQTPIQWIPDLSSRDKSWR